MNLKIHYRRALLIILTGILFLPSCTLPGDATREDPRKTDDFNFNWKFSLDKQTEAIHRSGFDDASWQDVRIPHDWSIELGFSQENTAASTGFAPGGTGWYRKKFHAAHAMAGRANWVEFDGIYNNSDVWINGHHLGHRPYGYSSFSYNLSPWLNYGDSNVLVVKVDHSKYADSRWYTGSGIYRNIRLVSASKIHIPQWGVYITTPEINDQKAEINAEITLRNLEEKEEEVLIRAEILDPDKKLVSENEASLMAGGNSTVNLAFTVQGPELWDPDHPVQYTCLVKISKDGKVIDRYEQAFGIRSIRFDADRGFFLNGQPVKLKGVNLHHDAGCVGAAVPEGVWRRRLQKLKDMGCNAVRTSHNPQNPVFLELCDELGILVIAEFFDEWDRPKSKNLYRLGDNLAPSEIATGYPEQFNAWAERDLKDCVRRDRNHPSVIMWSIGNEIEWTFPYYAQTFNRLNGDRWYNKYTPDYDPDHIGPVFRDLSGGSDTLARIAGKLAGWTKETDNTRPVTCGNVLPSIGMVSGYGTTVDVLGFNYRATEYDAAHRTYPGLKIYGSENWGSYAEWKACADRDFVAGIFVWTGISYLGESGPWPAKGLTISFFDFAGFKTPRGHFFECLWNEKPKVYMGTIPLAESEFGYTEEKGWDLVYRDTWIRRWEWFDLYDRWSYTEGEPILVQAYTNCASAELFLNGESQGARSLSDFEDRIIKWLVPFQAGELKILAATNGGEPQTVILRTPGEFGRIGLQADKKELKADLYDVVHIEASLQDAGGIPMVHEEREIRFDIEGDCRLLGIDNGSFSSIREYQSNRVVTANGKCLLILQAGDQSGEIQVRAVSGDVVSERLTIDVR